MVPVVISHGYHAIRDITCYTDVIHRISNANVLVPRGPGKCTFGQVMACIFDQELVFLVVDILY